MSVARAGNTDQIGMATPRKLRNAPIREALIDFRVKARRGIQAEEFRVLKSELANTYPIVEDRNAFEALLEFSDKGPTTKTTQRGVVGLFFFNADKTEVVQFRVDGFTFNRLRPYGSFDAVAPRALALWRRYVAIAQPAVVTRLALRYINQIPISGDVIEWRDYLVAGPRVPDQFPQRVSQFLTRVMVHDDVTDLAANVVQALEYNPETGGPVVLLDIEAFAQREIAPVGDNVNAVLAALRELKNRLFFSSVTDRTLAPFE
jgi:uncharacterized protein (TIGR04255 family)